MLSPNLMTKKEWIDAYFNGKYEPEWGLCPYCVEPRKADILIHRSTDLKKDVSFYCCAMCALGWLEIGDSKNDLVI